MGDGRNGRPDHRTMEAYEWEGEHGMVMITGMAGHDHGHGLVIRSSLLGPSVPKPGPITTMGPCDVMPAGTNGASPATSQFADAPCPEHASSRVREQLYEQLDVARPVAHLEQSADA